MGESEKIFLSHGHRDGEMAVELADWLQEAYLGQLEVICTSQTEYQISSGHMVTKGLLEHLRSSTIVLILITPNSLHLPWVYWEMGAAHALEKYFIPCVAGGVSLRELPPQAYEYQGANLSDVRDLDRLLQAIGDRLQALPAGDYPYLERIAERFRPPAPTAQENQ